MRALQIDPKDTTAKAVLRAIENAEAHQREMCGLFEQQLRFFETMHPETITPALFARLQRSLRASNEAHRSTISELSEATDGLRDMLAVTVKYDRRPEPPARPAVAVLATIGMIALFGGCFGLAMSAALRIWSK
jgi:hypothetical protein